MWQYVTSNIAWSLVGFATGYTVCKAEMKAYLETRKNERHDYR